MAKVITVIVKKVGKPPCIKKIDPTIENFCKLIDGSLHEISITEDSLMMYCDAEGASKGKSLNFVMGDYPNMHSVVGDVVFFRQHENHKSSVHANDIKLILTITGWQVDAFKPISYFVN